ncbi:MAG: hypothetical protein JXR18_13175 [Neptuniibacter sp.]
MEFFKVDPTLSSYWRSIILFGQNSASYKFALAKSLIDLSDCIASLVRKTESMRIGELWQIVVLNYVGVMVRRR